MKRKLWIMLALATLIAALWCGTAFAAERRVSGTVNVSTLPDHCSVILTGDTTLVVDVDKTLESIMGEDYALTIHGDHDLSIYSDNGGIYVDSFQSTLGGTLSFDMNHGSTIHAAPWDAAIMTNDDLSISGNVVVEGTNWGGGFQSKNGDIDVSGSLTSHTTNPAFLASEGNVHLSGDIYLHISSYMVATIIAHNDVVFSSGSLTIFQRGGIRSTSGNIVLNGEVNISINNHVASGVIHYDNVLPVNALGGNVTLQGQITINSTSGEEDILDTFPCIHAQNSITQTGGLLTVVGTSGLIAGGSINLTRTANIRTMAITNEEGTFPAGVGIRSENGNVTLSGTTTVYGNNGIEALNGLVYLHGNLEAGVADSNGQYAVYGKNGIQSDCTSITKNSPFYGLNGYYYVTKFQPTSGTGTMSPRLCWQGAQITMPGNLFDAPENCEFMCWRNAAHPNLQPGDSVTINSDTIFYAQWQRIPHTVTFAAGGGSGMMASVTVGQGEQLTLPACGFTASAGYEFDRSKIGTALYNPGSKVTIMADTTVIAQWKSDQAHVIFDANGGTGTMATVTLEKGTAFTLPECGFNPVRGKAFQYWKVSNASGYSRPGTIVTVYSDITVKAIWRQPKISFDANGGSGTMADVTLPANADGYYTLPSCSFTPPPNKVFDGWTDYGAAGATAVIYGDTVLKAQWADKMYTVSFIRGSNSSGTMSPVQVKSGSVYTFPTCTFTPPSGKIFRGWLLSGTVYHPGETIVVTGNMQLYAAWQENPDNVYTLTFDGDGLSGSMPSISAKSGETVTLPECMFDVGVTQRFQYWRVDVIAYHPGETITLSQNKTAKAVWVNRPLRTVTFATNGLYKGELPEAQQIYDGYLAEEPEALQMDGWIFKGWFTNMTTNEDYRWDFTSPVNSDLTLYCGWESAPPVAHPITIITDGHGTAEAKDAYDNPIEDQTKNNWVFLTATPDPGYELESIIWTSADGQIGYISTSRRFAMPDAAVVVAVTFRPVRVRFILPADMTALEDEAFAGIAATGVVIPGGVTSISGNPFAGSAVTTIYGYPGSAAETFVSHYPDYTFVPIDDEWMDGQ